MWNHISLSRIISLYPSPFIVECVFHITPLLPPPSPLSPSCQVCVCVSHHLAPLLSGAGLSEGEDVSADGDLSPDARFGVLCEAVARVHHQHAVGGQSVHLTVTRLPFSCLLLAGE